MRILVTGGAGYLGSMLVPRLLQYEEVEKVIVMDRLMYGGDSIAPLLNHPKFLFQEVVLGDGWWEPDNSYDVTIHLAALVGEEVCKHNKEEAYRTNFTSTVELINSAPKFIFASTCSNYGVCTKMADETTELDPQSYYAETKVRAELAVLEANQIVLRFGTLCGMSARMRYDLLLNELALAVANPIPSFEIRNPKAWRPYLHVVDACRAIELMVFRKNGFTPPNVFNVAYSNVTKEYLMTLVRRMSTIHFDVREGMERDYKVTSQKIAKAFGFVARKSIEDALEEMRVGSSMTKYYDERRNTNGWWRA